MMKGFERAGFICTQAPGNVTNPLRVEWRMEGQVRRYRLWAFDITHGGGGGSEVRAADEFRIQITNGPASTAAFDSEHARDLLVGYSRDRDAIVAYDRRWLENWTQKKEATGSGGVTLGPGQGKRQTSHPMKIKRASNRCLGTSLNIRHLAT
jgi:hypothetical protein